MCNKKVKCAVCRTPVDPCWQIYRDTPCCPNVSCEMEIDEYYASKCESNDA